MSDICLTNGYLSDSQAVGFSSVNFDFEVGMLFDDGFQSADKGIERLAGILFLRP